MKRRSQFLVLFASVVGLVLAVYCSLVVYLYLNRPADKAVADGDLIVETMSVSDDENMYVAYIAMTNVIRSSNVDVLLGELHKVATRSYYQGPTNSVSAFWSMNEIARKIDNAIEDFGMRSKYKEVVSEVRDFDAFAKSCRDNALSTVELSFGACLCNMVYMEVARLALDEKVPESILKELADIIGNEPDYKALFDRCLKCEYSFWCKPGLSQLSQNADISELMSKVEHVVDPDGTGCLAPIVARILAHTPGYLRFSYSGDASLQCVATVFREAQFDADRCGTDAVQIGVLEPNWYGRQIMLSICERSIKLARRTLKSDAMSKRFARIIVASQLYARRHGGQYPASLDVLVPEFIDAVPEDPFDSKHEIKYDCADKMIWSVGEDCEYEKPPSGRSRRCMRGFQRWARKIDGKPLM